MKQRKKRATVGEPQTITKAVTHIRLIEVNAGKLAALDALAPVYLALCQQYVTLFCLEEPPDKLRAPLYVAPLSERWQRVAIMQAAGIARSWRSNRATASQQYQDDLARYQKHQAEGTLAAHAKEPVWREWNVPTLREPCIQATVNVVKLEESHDSIYDYWLTISTLSKGQPIAVPVKLVAYHKEQLTDPQTHKAKQLNSSVQLNKRDGVWWLTLSSDEIVPVQTSPDAPVVGIDVGIANFVTTSTGKHYGSFHNKLRARHKRDRAKRRRKAKLRACLMKSSNRPNQQTFCCQVCGWEAHADHNAAINLSRRVGDTDLRVCRDRTAIKAVLMQRHETWKQHQGMETIRLVKRRKRGRPSTAVSSS